MTDPESYGGGGTQGSGRLVWSNLLVIGKGFIYCDLVLLVAWNSSPCGGRALLRPIDAEHIMMLCRLALASHVLASLTSLPGKKNLAACWDLRFCCCCFCFVRFLEGVGGGGEGCVPWIRQVTNFTRPPTCCQKGELMLSFYIANVETDHMHAHHIHTHTTSHTTIMSSELCCNNCWSQ